MPVGGYFMKDSPSITSLIPAIFGLLLLGCQKGIINEKKLISYLALALTLIVFLLLIMPLRFVIRKGDVIGIIQCSAMIITSLLAFIAFIKGFIYTRRSKQKS